MEYKAAVDSGVVVLAKHSGRVTKVDAEQIEILSDENILDHYDIIKFMRSNQGTCVNQRPIVTLNQRVEKGDVIADGPATDHGEISLGKNALVGFMTCLHLDSYRETRDRSERYKARTRGDHKGHPERLRRSSEQP